MKPRRRISAALSLLCAQAAACLPSAYAADIPVKAPPAAIVQQSGSFYVWVDGSYQSLGLPTYNLGTRLVTGPTAVFSGLTETHSPRVTGYGVSGAIGYLLPHGVLSAWGSNARLEVGGSYVRANDSDFVIGGLSDHFVVQRVNGLFHVNALCGTTCQTASFLHSDYAAWQVWGKAATDFRSGAVTITPSLVIFGGHGRTNQDYDQRMYFPTLAAFQAGTGLLSLTYNANSSLDWNDWGAKLGLEAKIDLASWLAVGIGGTLGVAARHASLSANDHFFTTVLDSRTAITAGASATPFLANAEASVIVKPFPAVALRSFVGLNYDSRVPGISGPSFVGSAFDSNVTPAGIKFKGETSWYVGGGVIVKFGS